MRRSLALLLFAACQDEVGSIVFEPVYTPPLSTQPYVCDSDPRKPSSLRVHLTADSQSYDQTVPFSNAAVQFDIPIGPMRTITIDVLDSQGCKLYTGMRTGLGFAEGDNGTLVVMMHRVNTTDTDHDALTVCMEQAFGTNDQSLDSDGDGYSDFCEVTGAAGTCTDATDGNMHPSAPASSCNPDGGVVDGGSGASGSE